MDILVALSSFAAIGASCIVVWDHMVNQKSAKINDHQESVNIRKDQESMKINDREDIVVSQCGLLTYNSRGRAEFWLSQSYMNAIGMAKDRQTSLQALKLAALAKKA